MNSSLRECVFAFSSSDVSFKEQTVEEHTSVFGTSVYRACPVSHLCSWTLICLSLQKTHTHTPPTVSLLRSSLSRTNTHHSRFLFVSLSFSHYSVSLSASDKWLTGWMWLWSRKKVKSSCQNRAWGSWTFTGAPPSGYNQSHNFRAYSRTYNRGQKLSY